MKVPCPPPFPPPRPWRWGQRKERGEVQGVLAGLEGGRPVAQAPVLREAFSRVP